MAATVANTQRLGVGGVGGELVISEVTLDSSYASGGESIAASLFGLSVIKAIWPAHAEGYNVEFARSTDATWLAKVYLHINITTSASALSPEVNVARDLSAVTIPVLIYGY